MSEVKLDLEPQDISTGYAIYHLTKIEVSATISPAAYESRKVTATFEQANPIQVAVPLTPGFPQSENTIILQNVVDQAQLMLQDVVNAINESLKTENDKGKGW